MNRPRILLVEDDPTVRELVKATLAELYEVVETEDGEAALDIVVTLRPDLVVLDWRLPGIWGGQVLDRLRALAHDVPVVVLTAERSDQTKILATFLGATVFLTKPFSPDVLLERIEALLG